MEVGLVLLLGVMLTPRTLTSAGWWFVPVLLLIVRPLAVLLGAPMRGAPASASFSTTSGWVR